MTYIPPDPPVMAYLMVHDGPAAIDWYGRALGVAVEAGATMIKPATDEF